MMRVATGKNAYAKWNGKLTVNWYIGDDNYDCTYIGGTKDVRTATFLEAYAHILDHVTLGYDLCYNWDIGYNGEHDEQDES